MSTMDVAQKFFERALAHKDEKILKTLFSTDAVSIEAAEMPGLPRELHGLEAIAAKGNWWRANNEVHSAKVEGPYPNGDHPRSSSLMTSHAWSSSAIIDPPGRSDSLTL